MIKIAKYEKNDIENLLKLVETQREIQIRLLAMKERRTKDLEELKLITAQAVKLSGLKRAVGRELLNLDDEIVKEINRLLAKRFLRL